MKMQGGNQPETQKVTHVTAMTVTKSLLSKSMKSLRG